MKNKELFPNGCPLVEDEFSTNYKCNKTILEHSKAHFCNAGLSIIEEELGSFPKQRELSKFCANEIINAYRSSGKMNGTIDVSKYNLPNIKIVEYELVMIPYGHSGGSISRVNVDGIVGFKLRVSDNILRFMQKNEAILIISDTISHELMRGNIYLNRAFKGQEINDSPEYYTEALVMKRDLCCKNPDDKFGLFAYALYNTYYHERQAIVSAFNVSLMRQNKNRKYKDNELLKKSILNNEIYNYYSTNIEIVTYFMNNRNEFNKLLDILEEYNIHFTPTELLNKMQWIADVSEDTIRKLYRNAMLVTQK